MAVLMIPTVATAVPSREPTQEEIEKEKEIQENAGAKWGWFWFWRTIPNRYQPPEYPNDIYPILYKRGHLLGTDLFNVTYIRYTATIPNPSTDPGLINSISIEILEWSIVYRLSLTPTGIL